MQARPNPRLRVESFQGSFDLYRDIPGVSPLADEFSPFRAELPKGIAPKPSGLVGSHEQHLGTMKIEDHSFFKLFAPAVAQQIIQIAEVFSFPDGYVIFCEGDSPDCLYLVLAGKVNIVKNIPGSAASQVIADVGENDYFGEYGVFDGRCRSAGAVACGDTTLARVPREPIMNVLNTAPGSSILELTRHLIQNIRNTNELYINDVVRKTKMTSLGMMLNTIVHDFRNPFTMIGLAASAIEKSQPDESSVEMCKLINEQIDRMNLMAEEILEFSRGTAKLNKKPTKVSEILQRFELLNRDYLEHSKVTLEVKAVDTVLDVDANKILRVLQNLVNNAAEMFAGQGGKISIIAETRGDIVEIAVKDNGPGIPEVIRGRLFEPFQSHGKEKGMGLGLVITKTLVEAHSGKVSVETKTGQGTTFFLRFPIIVPEAPPATPAAPG